MAAIFDWHVNVTLQGLIAEFAASAPLFRILFRKDDDEAGIPNAIIDGWHTELFPGGSVEHLALRQAFDTQKPRVVQITIKSQSDGAEEQPLGFGGMDPDVAEMLSIETVQLTCHAPNHGLLVAISTLVAGCMMAGRKTFERAGHHGLEYGGASDISPEERMILPDAFGAFARSQTWRAGAHQTAPITSGLKALAAFVHSATVTVSGTQGGVTPQ